MGWFGNVEKDTMLYEMNDFLENHTIYELLEIVEIAVETKESITLSQRQRNAD